MKNKFTLQEICVAVNLELSKDPELTASEDSRMKGGVSERLIRHYVSEDIVSKPIRDGKKVYYTQDHLDEILAVRKLKVTGVTDKLLKTMSIEYSSPEETLNNSDFDVDSTSFSSSVVAGSIGSINPEPDLSAVIDSINKRSEQKVPQLSSSSSLQSDKLLAGNLNELLRSSTKTKQIQPEKNIMDEYNITSDITLKVKSTTKIEDLKNLELIIKNILINYTQG